MLILTLRSLPMLMLMLILVLVLIPVPLPIPMLILMLIIMLVLILILIYLPTVLSRTHTHYHERYYSHSYSHGHKLARTLARTLLLTLVLTLIRLPIPAETVLSRTDYNVSHTVNHISFGHKYPGRVNGLDGVERLCDVKSGMYQYFIKVLRVVKMRAVVNRVQ